MQSLISLALAGTANTQSIPNDGSPSANMIASLVGLTVQQQLLLQAGAEAIYRQAGRLPAPGNVLPEPALSEDEPECTEVAADFIRSVLRDVLYTSVLIESLQRLHAVGKRLPFTMLDDILQWADTDYKQNAVRPVLGHRGVWLSSFKSDWAWVADPLHDADSLPPNINEIWEEGRPAARANALRRIRHSDPDRARDLLIEVWKQEKAETRLTLLKSLNENLRAADVAFLEQCMQQDRSQAVRELAVEHLTLIPESTVAARMRERAEAMISWDGTRLRLTPPKDLSEAELKIWKLDGLNVATGTDKQSRRNQLSEVFSRIPLAYWQSHFQCDLSTLIAAACHIDWGNTLLYAWRDALLRFEDHDHALLLWQTVTDETHSSNSLQAPEFIDLLALIPSAAQEQIALTYLQREDAIENDWIDDIVSKLSTPWSIKTSEVIVQFLKRIQSKFSASMYGTLDTIINAAERHLHPTVLDQVPDTWHFDESKDWRINAIAEEFEKLSSYCATRRQIYRLIE
jgi:Family of unknown function (DUF5691)